MKKYLLAVAGSLMLSSSAFAAGYGDAGCGLGSLVFGDTPGLVQVFAATTNGTFYSQAFGITSGTSNCDAKMIILAEKQQETFVKNNFSSLAKEMAVGKGEHLAALSGLLGCPAERTAEFGSFTRSNYGTIMAGDETTPSQMLNALKEGISVDPALSSTCSL